MRSVQQIRQLLDYLDNSIADDVEDQDLDFKQWDMKSRETAVRTVVHMAVCMANGGGGTVVFGVADKVKGREKAIVGVPLEIDINILKKAVYDRTDPKITPVFEIIDVEEGTGKLLVMHIYPGMPPYTDTAGKGLVRIGKECQPLTGTLRRKIGVETGESDFTTELIDNTGETLISPTAIELLRDISSKERAPQELMKAQDSELLNILGLQIKDKITKAALLIAGSERAIRRHIPGYNWTFLQMKSDTEYEIRNDKVSSIPEAISRIEDLILPFNPVSTLEHGMFHLEYRTYPAIAIREALMNAFCHADFRIAGPIMIKVYPDRLEISNNGGFIGGITEKNILHHPPASRNPLLVDALARLRLVNRSNLGISRIFTALLIEGKEPPIIREIGDSVTITFQKRELSPEFRMLVADENKKGRMLSVDELLILRYLHDHSEIDGTEAAKICQRDVEQVREILSNMENKQYLDRGGTGRGLYWTMNVELYRRLLPDDETSEQKRRIDWEAAKTRVVSILMERAKRREPGLRNKEIRQITHFNRNQVTRLMKELRESHMQIKTEGHGAGAFYYWKEE